MLHVDLVRNDFSAREQRFIGRVLSLGHDVKIECEDANIERILRGPLHDPDTGRIIAHTEGDEFVSLLSRTWDGTYVLATSVHDEGNCPFAESRVAPMVLTAQRPEGS